MNTIFVSSSQLQLVVIAGPNGSGKSTIMNGVNPGGFFVNADEIQIELGCDALTAAKIATATREFFLENRESFSFETVLSTKRNLDLMARAKQVGYEVICIFVVTTEPEINVRRVKSRVRAGGHDVPEEKIRARYIRSLSLFPGLFEVCDELYVYDNSSDRSEQRVDCILTFEEGQIQIFPNAVWDEEMIQELIGGKYPQRFESLQEESHS